MIPTAADAFRTIDDWGQCLRRKEVGHRNSGVYLAGWNVAVVNTMPS